MRSVDMTPNRTTIQKHIYAFSVATEALFDESKNNVENEVFHESSQYENFPELPSRRSERLKSKEIDIFDSNLGLSFRKQTQRVFLILVMVMKIFA